MRAPPSVSRHCRTFARSALLGGVLLAAASCGRFRSGQGDEDDQPTAQIVFTNESLDQADVYAAAPSGETIRMGTVMAGRTETLAIPTGFVTRGSVNIVARLLARSTALRTGQITISSGDRIQVTLPVNGNLLSVLPAQ